MQGRTRVVVVGLDAVDERIARQLAAEGRMPTLASLLEHAAGAPTLTPPGFVVGSTWPSITTGCWPSRHGFYCDLQLVSGTYEAVPCGPDVVTVPRLWDVLSEHDRRSAVLDVPLTVPSTTLSGVQLVEWGAHDRIAPRGSRPPSFVDEVIARYGEYPVQHRCDWYGDDLRGLRDALLRGLGARGRLAADCFGREEWDLFMVAFSEGHCAGHQFWKQHDPAHHEHDPALRDELGDVMLDVYSALDAELGAFLAIVPDDVAVFVLLSHGMGSHNDGNHLIYPLLRGLDRAAGESRVIEFRERVISRVQRGGRAVRRASKLDGSRRWYEVPNNTLFGSVRVNLKGREPRGRIAPRDYDEVVEELRADLRALENPDTGGPVVDDVLRVDELYDGPLLDRLPDLLIDWHRSVPIRAASSPKLGTVRGEPVSIRSGDHRAGGLVLAYGTGAAPGLRREPIPVVDLSPTIAAVAGVDFPDCDGRVADTLVGSRDSGRAREASQRQA